MNDIKNIFIAWISTSTSLFAAIELKTVLSILSAVVLPIVFFSIGKTVDVLVQIYNSDSSVDVRKQVVNALFIQENATALVALARKEQER